MNKSLTIPVKNQYQYIQLLNGIFDLTEMEMRVLSLFALQGTFSPEAKKKVADQLNKDNPNHLNTYIKRLKDKQVIYKKDGDYHILPLLLFKGTQSITLNING